MKIARKITRPAGISVTTTENAVPSVKAVVEAFFYTVTKTSRKEPVRTTLGTFVVAKRAARMGRNPQTGEAIKIAASKKFRFRPSKSTKEAVM